jgi:hypothetical protein
VSTRPRPRWWVGEKGDDFGPELAGGAVINQPAASFWRVRAYVIATVIAQFPEVTFKMHQRHGRWLALLCRAFDCPQSLMSWLTGSAASA